mmetsp:Transcript_7533/g.24832  ORF Transcript_7533/g.24832 Transcript_7533/m.24832 type:complete len:282 (+) Transcript_7533:3122-3967(+)
MRHRRPGPPDRPIAVAGHHRPPRLPHRPPVRRRLRRVEITRHAPLAPRPPLAAGGLLDRLLQHRLEPPHPPAVLPALLRSHAHHGRRGLALLDLRFGPRPREITPSRPRLARLQRRPRRRRRRRRQGGTQPRHRRLPRPRRGLRTTSPRHSLRRRSGRQRRRRRRVRGPGTSGASRPPAGQEHARGGAAPEGVPGEASGSAGYGGRARRDVPRGEGRSLRAPRSQRRGQVERVELRHPGERPDDGGYPRRRPLGPRRLRERRQVAGRRHPGQFFVGSLVLL